MHTLITSFFFFAFFRGFGRALAGAATDLAGRPPFLFTGMGWPRRADFTGVAFFL